LYRTYVDHVSNPRKDRFVAIKTTTEDAIRESLNLDPRIPDPEQIAVACEDGTAVLRGTVGSFSQRRAAVSDTRSVEDVYDVDDQLQVRLLNEDRRDDADLRGIALQILMWDTEVPSDVVDVKVNDGWVTLTGDVSYQFESDAAYDDVSGLTGVVGVTNEIRVINP
jgi:osmotically-inducible protein OsmY